MNQLYQSKKNQDEISPKTSPSSSKGSQSPGDGFFTKLSPGDSNTSDKESKEENKIITNVFPEAKKKAKVKVKAKTKTIMEEDDFNLPMICGVDLGCFKA